MTATIEYAIEVDAATVASELRAAREAGFKRPELADLTGLTPAKVWRAEQGRLHASEYLPVRSALDKIASGEVKPAAAQRSASAEQVRIDAALRAIAGVPDKATKAELWAALASVAATLGNSTPAVDPGE